MTDLFFWNQPPVNGADVYSNSVSDLSPGQSKMLDHSFQPDTVIALVHSVPSSIFHIALLSMPLSGGYCVPLDQGVLT
jgi:hypothetical protein